MRNEIRSAITSATNRFAWLITAAILAWSSAFAAHADEPAALPGNSVYQLPLHLSDQDKHSFALTELRGKPVIVSMFYNSCQFVCPMLIDTISQTVAALDPAQRQQLRVLLVTFDPARDDNAVLHGIVEQRKLDTATWTLARCEAACVRKLAAALGVQYRRLPNGDYNHSTALILLDSEGRIAGSSNQIGTVDREFAALVTSVVLAKAGTQN